VPAGIPAGVPVDPRRDMLRELIAVRLAAEFADAEGALHEIVQTGEQRSQARSDQVSRPRRVGAPDQAAATAQKSAPSSEAVQRALQGLQRDAGLPVTGRFDAATVTLLVQLGVVSPPPPANTAPNTPATTPPTTTTTTPAPERRPIDATLQALKRASINQQGQALRARVDGALETKGPATARGTRAPDPPPTPVDRALDPARLLASLVAAGFRGDTPTAAVSSFQTAHALPPSGQLDPRTVETMAANGIISAEAAAAHADSASSASSSSSAASSSAKSSRGEGGAASAAGGEGAKGSGAKDGAQRVKAPASSPEEARERARLESLLAAAAATERGVQESKGDPAALAGHGVLAGNSVGISGAGGADGGGTDAGGDEASAAKDDGPAGDEDSVGNANAGDDDHDDDERGEASDAAGNDNTDDDVIPDGHYRTPCLHDQVHAALDTITRLDDDDGPVCYTWDVTLYRPGIYSDGQPAEAIWHLVVDRAHAFDPVWERATVAIATRLLYIEPDAVAPSLDDVLGALKRARVR